VPPSQCLSKNRVLM